MTTQYMSISDLNPASYNPRKITKRGMERLVASVREHTAALAGWAESDGFRLASTITINIQGNRIVGGHQRVEALRALGQAWVHPDDITWVDVLPDSPEEKSLNISLNESSGDWDMAALDSMLHSIEESGKELYDALSFSTIVEDTVTAVSKAVISADVKDHLDFIVREILEKHGDSVQNGFIFFCYKNRLHLIVLCNRVVYGLLKQLTEGLHRNNVLINDYLESVLLESFDTVKWHVLKHVAEELQDDREEFSLGAFERRQVCDSESQEA